MNTSHILKALLISAMAVLIGLYAYAAIPNTPPSTDQDVPAADQDVPVVEVAADDTTQQEAPTPVQQAEPTSVQPVAQPSAVVGNVTEASDTPTQPDSTPVPVETAPSVTPAADATVVDGIQEQPAAEPAPAAQNQAKNQNQNNGSLTTDEEIAAGVGLAGLTGFLVKASMAADAAKKVASSGKDALDAAHSAVQSGQKLADSGRTLLQGESVYKRQAIQTELDRQRLFAQGVQQQAARKVETYRAAGVPEKQAAWQVRLAQANQLQANVKQQQTLRTQLENAQLSPEERLAKQAEAENFSKNVTDFEKQQAQTRLNKYQNQPTLNQSQILKRDAAQQTLERPEQVIQPRPVAETAVQNTAPEPAKSSWFSFGRK
jgi:hypothetical protein